MTDAPSPGETASREASRRGKPLATLTLVRHGEPDWAAMTDAGMPRDPVLTSFGRAQADATAAALCEQPCHGLYVSPMARALQTAAPFAEATGLEPIVLPDLEEFRFDASGMNLEEVDARFRELSQRPLEEHWEGWPGVEDFRDFHQRTTGALEELLARHGIRARQGGEFTVWDVQETAHSLVLFAHGGTNAVLLTHLLGIPPVPWEWLRFECELSAYAVVQARPIGHDGGSVWALQNFNELDHLRAAGLR
jgi:broad specificity phosphatase PhoE